VFTSVLAILLNLSFVVLAKAADKYYYQLRIYHIKTKAQEDRLDAYLKKAYLPALHKAGIKNVGVFKPVDQDTTSDKRVYVFIPYKNWDQLENTDKKVWADQDYQNAGKDY